LYGGGMRQWRRRVFLDDREKGRKVRRQDEEIELLLQHTGVPRHLFLAAPGLHLAIEGFLKLGDIPVEAETLGRRRMRRG
jgi:hypothetical protein